MLYGLKGTHPTEGELYQEFTANEMYTALAIAEIWQNLGWKPLLIERHWHGCNISHLNQQRKAA